MLLTLLGTGTSTGVPQLGCTCPVCRSTDPHDHRLRASALVDTDDGTRTLIDCGPDFRLQMLEQHFQPLNAVLITHEHYDHLAALDDLRPYCRFGDIDIYGEAHCLNSIKQRMPYCFVEHRYPGTPSLRLHPITPGTPFRVGNQTILPLRVYHGALPILAFRIGPMAYITDAKTVPDDTIAHLHGITTLVINGLRHTPHGSHQTIEEAIHVARRIGTQPTYITHLAHQAGLHAKLEETLPTNVHVAYDGLKLSC